MSSPRFQSFALSLGIGILLTVVFTGGLALNAAVIMTIVAIALWTVKVIERPQPDLLIAVIGFILGIVVAVIAPLLLGIPEAAVVILILAVLM